MSIRSFFVSNRSFFDVIFMFLPLTLNISELLFPFFSNMLSEGHNRRVQARLLHVDEDDEFGILAQTALYDTPGAVTVKPIDL